MEDETTKFDALAQLLLIILTIPASYISYGFAIKTFWNWSLATIGFQEMNILVGIMLYCLAFIFLGKLAKEETVKEINSTETKSTWATCLKYPVTEVLAPLIAVGCGWCVRTLYLWIV